MKKSRLFLIFTVLIFLITGCGLQSMGVSESALPPEDGAKEITVEAMDFSSGFLTEAAKKFEAATGIKVTVKNDYDPEAFKDDTDAVYQKIQDRVQAELLAGKGPDIYINFYFFTNKSGKQKQLRNLAGWISKEPDFTDDHYYMSLLRSQADENKIYALPLFIMCTTLGSTVEVPELKDQGVLSWEQFFEKTKNTGRNGVLYALTDYEIFKRRFRDRESSFIDEKNKTQNLNTPEMVDLLKQCKAWSAENLCIKYSTADESDVFQHAFLKEYGCGIEGLLNVKCDPSLYFYDPPSDAAVKDRSNKILPIDYACINGTSKHPGTAWKFIKFLLSEDIQLSNRLDTPVNRKAAEHYLANELSGLVQLSGDKIDADKTIKDTSDTLNSFGSIKSKFATALENVLFAEAKPFFLDRISAQTAAKNMADKMTLYLKEQ